ncbi:MAG: helix-turn-helix transcriptional regulator [Ruminiclostridium sp.]|nr:helix-turn-helix transcriptional regulator [Ruminiclostridium sp.]
MLKLGENIKKHRQRRELTQEQLAEVFGVSAQAVSR